MYSLPFYRMLINKKLSTACCVIMYVMGTERHSIASKNRWKSISPEERSKLGRDRALKRWAKVSKADRKKYAMKMVAARVLLASKKK